MEQSDWFAAALPYIIPAVASLAGGLLSNKSSSDQAEQNTAYQREFAQQGVRWKATDAKAAGLHPLAALGAQTTSYQSQTFPDQVGPAMSRAGQYAGKYLQKRQDTSMQADFNAINKEIQAEQLKGLKIDNMGKLQELNQNLQGMGQNVRQLSDTPGPTGDPLTDQLNQPGTNVTMQKPEQVIQKSMGVTAGMHPFKKHYIDEDGWIYPLMDEKASEAMENDPANKYKYLTMQGAKYWKKSSSKKRPKIKVPQGYELRYHWGPDLWRLHKTGKYRVPAYQMHKSH